MYIVKPALVFQFHCIGMHVIEVLPIGYFPLPTGETYQLTITSTGPWTLTENQTWITTTAQSGGSGVTNINVTVLSNPDPFPRNYTIVFTLTGTSKTASHTIVQNQQ